MNSFKNVLAIGAHYDDVELGCGGTLAKLRAEGCNVYKLTLTDNETHFNQLGINVDTDSSIVCSAKACEVLGVREITDFQPAPCNRLAYSSDLMQRIEKIIFEKNIDTVFIHYDQDINQDHIAASSICLTAARYCKNILMFYSNGYLPRVQFAPTIFFDISAYFDLKKKALAQYDSVHDRFSNLFGNALKRNEVHGYACQSEAAEGFMPVKMTL